MATRLTVTSSFLFLGVLAFVAHLGGGAPAATTEQGTRNHRGEPSRHIKIQDRCSTLSISIDQISTGQLPNGTPVYTVEVVNTCESGCNISNIHVSCGPFSSAILVNPKIFKRLSFDDCLVNDGKTLPNGKLVSFEYANSYPYELSVSSVRCTI